MLGFPLQFINIVCVSRLFVDAGYYLVGVLLLCSICCQSVIRLAFWSSYSLFLNLCSLLMFLKVSFCLSFLADCVYVFEQRVRSL